MIVMGLVSVFVISCVAYRAFWTYFIGSEKDFFFIPIY
jgi:hypothetical protein